MVTGAHTLRRDRVMTEHRDGVAATGWPGVVATDESPDAPRIGVLALQGDFREHARMLTELGARVIRVRRPEDLSGLTDQQTLGGFDITVRRNAFGSQNESFETDLDIPLLGAPPVHAVFIRAPVVESLGPAVTALARLEDGRVV